MKYVVVGDLVVMLGVVLVNVEIIVDECVVLNGLLLVDILKKHRIQIVYLILIVSWQICF